MYFILSPKLWGRDIKGMSINTVTLTREAMCIFTDVQKVIILKIRFCIELFEIRYLCFQNILMYTYIIVLVQNHCGIIIYLRDIKVLIRLICT